MSAKRLFLGIDTSNYTTSVAACDENGNIVCNLKRLLDVKEGERGLRQSDAVFSHIKNLPILAEELRGATDCSEIAAIGVSSAPRDVEGSYMPCFLAGRACAHVVAATHSAHIYEFSHQAGHIMAALHSCGHLDRLIKNDFIAFHISGGTTEALYVKPNASSFDVRIVYDTADISAGQAIDRAGVMMGLKFPCGRELEALAESYDGKIPKPKICVKNGRCNLSGVENMAQKLYDDTNNRSLVAAFVLDFIGETLKRITSDLRTEYPNVPILYAGGVMSNKKLKQMLSAFDNVYFSEPAFSADNAAGIALLARKNHK